MGCELSAITFVRDYVQLAFDGPNMNAYTAATVSCGAESFRLGQPGYRDALCKPIGSRVARVEADDERVSISFEDGTTISISLRADDYRGPEALQFSLDNDCIWVV